MGSLNDWLGSLRWFFSWIMARSHLLGGIIPTGSLYQGWIALVFGRAGTYVDVSANKARFTIPGFSFFLRPASLIRVSLLEWLADCYRVSITCGSLTLLGLLRFVGSLVQDGFLQE